MQYFKILRSSGGRSNTGGGDRSNSGGVLLRCYSPLGFIIPTAEAGFALSKQITLLDLPVGKGGFIIADPFIIPTAVQQGSGWIGALHKRVLIFLHRLGSSRGGGY